MLPCKHACRAYKNQARILLKSYSALYAPASADQSISMILRIVSMISSINLGEEEEKGKGEKEGDWGRQDWFYIKTFLVLGY